jgi:hypothetical protein
MKISTKITLTLTDSEYKVLRDLIYVAKETSYYQDCTSTDSYDEDANVAAYEMIDTVERFCTAYPEPFNLEMYRQALESKV